MKRSTHQPGLNWHGFLKACVVQWGVVAVVGLGFGMLQRFKPWNLRPTRVRSALHQNARMIVQSMEERWILPWGERLQALSDTLARYRVSDWEAEIQAWHQRYPPIFSVTVHSVELRWPIHQIDPSFWGLPEVQAIPDSSRSLLFDFLLQRPEEVFPSSEQSLWMSRVLHPKVLGYPVVTLHYKRLQGVKSFSLQIRMEGFPAFCDSLAHALGTPFGFLDPEKRWIYLSPGLEAPDLQNGNDDLRVTQTCSLLPWTLVLMAPREIVQTEGKIRGLFLAGLLGLGIFGGSWILTRWIDRPLRPLFEMAFQISRGDFSKRVPETRNPLCNRIGRILNYMAEEMDHIQQMNVSRIIVEKNKTETILKNIADGVIVTDNADRILLINPVAERWFDLRESDVRNEPISEHLRTKRLLSLIKDVRTGQKDAEIDFHLRCVDTGEEKIFHAHAAPVKGEDDRRIGVVTVLRDVTQQREIERMKTELVSMVAHELKSPLTSICGFSELLLQSGLENDRALGYARVIYEESNRLTDLVNKFLDLSRLESGRTEPNIQPMDLKEAIRRLLKTHGRLANQKQIRVITEIPAHLSRAMADPDMIDQVLINLFSNAVKYSPIGAKIGIEVQETENTLVVQVIDNGIGIPKEELPKIFDKFYRVKSEDSVRPEGSGLGLSLVKQIIERHGGVVRVKSQPGIGSIFSFTLPKEL